MTLEEQILVFIVRRKRKLVDDNKVGEIFKLPERELNASLNVLGAMGLLKGCIGSARWHPTPQGEHLADVLMNDDT